MLVFHQSITNHHFIPEKKTEIPNLTRNNYKHILKRTNVITPKPYFAANSLITATIPLPGTHRQMFLLGNQNLTIEEKGKIRTEASRRINGEYDWPVKPGEKLVPWMVTAEIGRASCRERV